MWKYIFPASCFICLNFFCTPLIAQERSADDFLNSALAKKPQISVKSTVWKTRMRCRPLPKSADGGEACYEEKYQESSVSQTPATVTSTKIAVVKNFKFDEAKLINLPSRILINSKEYANCADVQLTSSVTIGVSGTKSWSVSKTEGVSTTVGGSATLTGNATYGSGSVTLNYSQAVSTSTTVSESFSETASRSTTDSISVGPHKVGRFTLFAYQVGADIPFSGEVIVDGSIRENVSAITNASNLLSEAERTMRVRGVLRTYDVSAAKVKTEDLAFSPECSGANAGAMTIEERVIDVPDNAVTSKFLNGFVSQSKLSRDEKTKVAIDSQVKTKSEIGAPEGTKYEVLYVTETSKPTVQCGFNDVSIPNLGIFKVEARVYRTYVQGKIVAQWDQQVESFLRCAPTP